MATSTNIPSRLLHHVESWCRTKLRELMGFDDVDSVVHHLLQVFSAEAPARQLDAVKDLLGNDQKVQQFAEELSQRCHQALGLDVPLPRGVQTHHRLPEAVSQRGRGLHIRYATAKSKKGQRKQEQKVNQEKDQTSKGRKRRERSSEWMIHSLDAVGILNSSVPL